jgi:hypothetical protein
MQVRTRETTRRVDLDRLHAPDGASRALRRAN